MILHLPPVALAAPCSESCGALWFSQPILSVDGPWKSLPGILEGLSKVYHFTHARNHAVPVRDQSGATIGEVMGLSAEGSTLVASFRITALQAAIQAVPHEVIATTEEPFVLANGKRFERGLVGITLQHAERISP